MNGSMKGQLAKTKKMGEGLNSITADGEESKDYRLEHIFFSQDT